MNLRLLARHRDVLAHFGTAVSPIMLMITGLWTEREKTEKKVETLRRSTTETRQSSHTVHFPTPTGPLVGLTISLLGASISSIIMLSRVNEVRFSVLDLSELKERRLGVVAVAVTDNQDNSRHNDGNGEVRGRGVGG